MSTNEAMQNIKLNLNKVEVRENLNNLNSFDIIIIRMIEQYTSDTYQKAFPTNTNTSNQNYKWNFKIIIIHHTRGDWG